MTRPELEHPAGHLRGHTQDSPAAVQRQLHRHILRRAGRVPERRRNSSPADGHRGCARNLRHADDRPDQDRLRARGQAAPEPGDRRGVQQPDVEVHRQDHLQPAQLFGGNLRAQ